MNIREETLKIARNLIKKDPSLTNWVINKFPELKESGDEDKIMKELIYNIIVSNDSTPSSKEIFSVYSKTKEDALAWLEKQTKQKLYANDNAKEMFVKALERVEEQNAKGYKLTDCDKNSWWEDFKNYTSCTIEQKPAETKKETKGNKRKIPISAWSDEDEKQARQIERIVHNDGCTQKLQKQIADWFNSLKDRYTWKPSDEQIKALEQLEEMHVLRCEKTQENAHLYVIIKSLKEQLKQL